MKKFLLISLLAIFFSVYINAQGIRYESSFEKAKNLALQQKKPLAVLITIQTTGQYSWFPERS